MQKHHTAHLAVDASDKRDALLEAFDQINVARDFVHAGEMMAGTVGDSDGSAFQRILATANEGLVSALGLIRIALGTEFTEGEQDDPLLAVIASHRQANAAFNAVREEDYAHHGGEDEIVQQTFGPTRKRLSEWQTPAQSRVSAIAALGLADEENNANQCSDISRAMVRAALAFFDGDERHEH